VNRGRCSSSPCRQQPSSRQDKEEVGKRREERAKRVWEEESEKDGLEEKNGI